MMVRKICLSAVALVLLVTATPACKALKKPYPDQKFYLLEATRVGPPQLAGRDLVLEVKQVEVASAYSGREFVYRQADGTITRDFYHGFIDLPETLLTEVSRLWFSGDGMDPVVVRTHGPVDVSHVLQGRVLRLMADYSEQPARAMLEIEFLMAEERGRKKAPIFRRVYFRDPVLMDALPGSLVTAWNTSLAEIMTELENDMVDLHLVRWTPPDEETP